MGIGGEALLATGYHGKPTAAGSAGVIPRHTVFLENWLASHQHTFWQPDFAQIMRDYKIKYVLMQMRSADEEVLWQEAQVADTVRAVDCFQPPDGPSAWPWSICVVEIPPAPSPDFNVLWGDGWSGREGLGSMGRRNQVAGAVDCHSSLRRSAFLWQPSRSVFLIAFSASRWRLTAQ